MSSKGSHSVQTQPESDAVAQPQETSSSVSSRWKWVLYVIAGIGIVLALKYFHVQDLLKSALDWQAWAVGAGDFRRPLRCGDGIVRSRLGAHAWGWRRVRRGSWLRVCIHQRNTGCHGSISGGPLSGARCHRAEDREEREVRHH